MPTYRPRAEGPDRAKAIAAVAAVHLALAMLILSGLNVRQVGHVGDALTTVQFHEAPVQAVHPPKSSPPRQLALQPARPAASEARPTPIVAPLAKLPARSPLAVSIAPAAGAFSSSGHTFVGSGTGADGSGTGSGGTGAVDYSRFTPARLVQNIPNSEYRRLAATGIPSGMVGVIILVEPSGAVTDCRIARTSGDSSIDALVCALATRFVRFDPARDSYGRPVAQDVTYFPSWRRR